MFTLEAWLEYQGFGNFTEFPGETYSYEDKPVSQGGIRIEICGDVASIWCPLLRLNYLAVPKTDVRVLTEQMLFDLGRLRKTYHLN